MSFKLFVKLKFIFMKKTTLSLALALIGITFMEAQNSVPNGNFESWTSGTYYTPNGYIGSNPSTFFRCSSPFNSVRTTDAYHGTYAVQVTTNVGIDTCMGYMVNAANPNGNNPCQWQGGMPFTQTPTGFRGYYKCNVATGDSAGILVAFRKNGACLGMYMHKFAGIKSTYTLFSFPFSPALSATPDTVLMAIVSSNVFSNIQKNGRMFQVDSLSFTGIASQPSIFNGDFENWQSLTVNKPNNWYLQSDDQGDGVYQTTDKEAGTYAVELKTYLGSKGGKTGGSYSIAQGAGISTGYYPNNCNGNCQQKGGNPFTNQIDTLAFYYKYAPSGSDTASANLNFKKNGVFVSNSGTFLLASSSYKYVEIPFSLGTAVDSVIIGFQSSGWRDTTLGFIGSDFKVDEVHFKSQAMTTGIQPNEASTIYHVFPNPSLDGAFTLTNIKPFDLVRVYNVFGQEVSAELVKESNHANIQIHSSGAYFIQVNSSGKVFTQKIIVTK